MKKKILLACDPCGIETNRLTCLKKYGREPRQAKYTTSTYQQAPCDVCGIVTLVTSARDFFWPDFSLLPDDPYKNDSSKA